MDWQQSISNVVNSVDISEETIPSQAKYGIIIPWFDYGIDCEDMQGMWLSAK